MSAPAPQSPSTPRQRTTHLPPSPTTPSNVVKGPGLPARGAPTTPKSGDRVGLPTPGPSGAADGLPQGFDPFATLGTPSKGSVPRMEGQASLQSTFSWSSPAISASAKRAFSPCPPVFASPASSAPAPTSDLSDITPNPSTEIPSDPPWPTGKTLPRDEIESLRQRVLELSVSEGGKGQQREGEPPAADELASIALRLADHALEVDDMPPSKLTTAHFSETAAALHRVEVESLRRQAEALSWKLERVRWDARLNRWEDLEEVEQQGVSVVQDDLETENRMLAGDKRVLKAKLEEALTRASKLEHDLRTMRATLITKAHPPLDAWQTTSWHDGDVKRSHYGMGDARAEHLLLASRRLGELVNRGIPLEYQEPAPPPPEPIKKGRRRPSVAAPTATPTIPQHASGLENLLNAANSLFEGERPSTPTSGIRGYDDEYDDASPPARGVTPPESPKRRRVPQQSPRVGAREWVPGGVRDGMPPNAGEPTTPGRKRTALDMLAGSALDVLADQAAEHGSPRNASPSQPSASRAHEPHPLLGPALTLRQPTSTSPSRPVQPPPRTTQTYHHVPHQHPSVTPVKHHPAPSGSSPAVPGFTSVRPPGSAVASRAPYTKWTAAEDALLAKAVAIHGQKWDAVSKMVGTRSYHQVRQRYLRKSSQAQAAAAQAAAKAAKASEAPEGEDGAAAKGDGEQAAAGPAAAPQEKDNE